MKLASAILPSKHVRLLCPALSLLQLAFQLSTSPISDFKLKLEKVDIDRQEQQPRATGDPLLGESPNPNELSQNPHASTQFPSEARPLIRLVPSTI